MNIIITGANGQLGRALKKQFKDDKDIKLLLTDICEMDVTDTEDIRKVFTSFKPDAVINCAAHTAVDLCEDDVEKAFYLNKDAAKNLAKIANDFNAKILHMSTDYVFDGESSYPYIESDTPNPQSVYGKSKLAGENEVIKNNDKHFVLRTAWLYGEGKNFVNTMLTLSKKLDSLKVVNDQIGSPTSTKEVAKAISLLIKSEEYGIYHATCEGYCSWYDFAKTIFKLNDIDIKVSPCSSDEFPMKAKRPKYSVLDNKNLREKFDYSLVDWEQAIQEFFS